MNYYNELDSKAAFITEFLTEVNNMSMVACAVCGGTIDCSGDGWYACRKCGKAIHTECDPGWKPGDEFICPECREKDDNESEAKS